MKELVVYTVLRLVLLVACFAVTAFIWGALNGGEYNVFGTAVIAVLVSGLISFVLLNRQREALAHKVEQRAGKASAAFEARKAREDVD